MLDRDAAYRSVAVELASDEDEDPGVPKAAT
jgi:hypothetical protein